MKRFIIVALVFIPLLGIGQPVLTMEEAVAIALENNYDIRLVAKDADVATNNVHVGNAGMLPSVSGDVSAAASIQNTTQTLLSGETSALRGRSEERRVGKEGGGTCRSGGWR